MVEQREGTGMSRAMIEEAIANSPYVLDLGVELVAFAPSAVTVRLPVQRRLAQHHGFVHGAIVGFMADTACAWAAASVAGDVVTSEYKLNFLAPAIGEALIARGSVIKAGARQVVARADIFAVRDGAERIVATALATIARV